MNYVHHKAEEFAALESFQEYYLFKNPEAEKFWKSWIEKHPEKNAEILAAQKILDAVHLNVSHQEAEIAFQNLKQRIDQQQMSKPGSISPRRRFIQIISATAAAFLLFLTAYHFLSTEPSAAWATTKTAFGEMKALQLPDGSQVFLNSNSTLKYDSNWIAQSLREVWLEGEAYFEVNEKPTKGAAPFIVHSDDTQIKVLGTVFNVYHRNEKVAVVLESGQVAVAYQQNGKQTQQLMAPKDLFEIDANQQVNFYQGINTQLYTAWKENKLVLDQTPLKKVVNILEDNFGFEVTVANKEILNRKLTATIPIIDINILLDALEEIYGLEIKKENRKIWIE